MRRATHSTHRARCAPPAEVQASRRSGRLSSCCPFPLLCMLHHPACAVPLHQGLHSASLLATAQNLGQSVAHHHEVLACTRQTRAQHTPCNRCMVQNGTCIHGKRIAAADDDIAQVQDRGEEAHGYNQRIGEQRVHWPCSISAHVRWHTRCTRDAPVDCTHAANTLCATQLLTLH